MPDIYKMSFGKHRGQSLHTLPKHYLRWLETIDLDPFLAGAVQRALAGEKVFGPTEDEKVDAAKAAALARLSFTKDDEDGGLNV